MPQAHENSSTPEPDSTRRGVPESNADRQRRIMAGEREHLRKGKAACAALAKECGGDPDMLWLQWLQWLVRREDNLGCQQSEVTNATADAIAAIKGKREGGISEVTNG